jgi:hypothetical protein
MSEYSNRRISDTLPAEWQVTYNEIIMTPAYDGSERFLDVV